MLLPYIHCYAYLSGLIDACEIIALDEAVTVYLSITTFLFRYITERSEEHVRYCRLR